SGKTDNDPWTVHPISEEPTTHRMIFADLDRTGKPQLIVSPLMGRDSTRPDFAEKGVRLLSFTVPTDPVNGPWVSRVLNDELHVSHNLQATDLNGDGQLDLLVVSFEGVHVLERKPDGVWKR